MQSLRYGENPDQAAAFYAPTGVPRVGIAGLEQHHGKELSYNNLLDLDSALAIVRALPEASAAVIKHNNPCGAASAESLAEAAHQAGAQIADDIAEQVGGDNHVELVGIHHQLHAGGVDDHLLATDVGVFGGHLARNLQEQAGHGFEDVGLVHQGDFFAASRPRQFEGVARYALAALAGDHDLGFGRRSALAGLRIRRQVSALGVFAYGDDVDVVEAPHGRAPAVATGASPLTASPKAAKKLLLN